MDLLDPGHLGSLTYVGGALSALLLVLLVFRFASGRTRQGAPPQSLVDLINAELPQTQCGHCSYPGCLPYARAIAAGEPINRCAPGGTATIRRLSRLLNEQREALDPAHGTVALPVVASIREEECIGCARCIQACPVDAIVGSGKLMHTVIAAECTGCDLCIDPCPVDCIDLSAHDPATPSRPPAAASSAALPCIRCGFCAEVCPARLLPQQLLYYGQQNDPETQQDHGLLDCTECGLCDEVCPSRIPLVAHFQASKELIAREEAARERSAHWHRRFERRQQRKENPHPWQSLQQPSPTTEDPPPIDSDFSRQQARKEIAAAVARVKQKRAKTG